jgi:hypothetical protein
MELEREMLHAMESTKKDSPFLPIVKRRIELWLAEIAVSLDKVEYLSELSLKNVILEADKAGDIETRDLAIKQHLANKGEEYGKKGKL